VFALGFVLLCLMKLFTVAMQPFYGDLSRIGRLSEREFGWSQPQPKIDLERLASVPLEQADILVIGDSFSSALSWQSVLVAQGYQLATTTWPSLGVDVLCGDFDDWLARGGFRGRLVIVQMVERGMAARLRGGEQCASMAKPLSGRAVISKGHGGAAPPVSFNWTAPLDQGLRTWWNTRRALDSPGEVAYHNPAMLHGTVVRPVPEGCHLFSHRRCEKALFLFEDLGPGPLTVADVESMRAFNAAHAMRVLWMAVPNKTSVYVLTARSERFAAAIGDSGLGPDLFTWAQAQRTQTRDLYYPNDTHLSLRGQLALGEVMLAEVHKRLSAPRP
jgi:hypothetical protein